MNQENKECCEKCLMGSAIPDPWCNNKDCPCHLPSAPQECKHEAFSIKDAKRYCWNCGKYLGDIPQESKDWESALKEFADYWWREPNERHRWVTIELPLKHFIRTQKQLSYEEGRKDENKWFKSGDGADYLVENGHWNEQSFEAGRTEAFAEVEAKLNDFIFGAFDNKDEYWVTKDSVRKLFDWLQKKLT